MLLYYKTNLFRRTEFGFRYGRELSFNRRESQGVLLRQSFIIGTERVKYDVTKITWSFGEEITCDKNYIWSVFNVTVEIIITYV